MERMEALTNYYTTHNEDARLTPKRGMVEFLTTHPCAIHGRLHEKRIHRPARTDQDHR